MSQAKQPKSILKQRSAAAGPSSASAGPSKSSSGLKFKQTVSVRMHQRNSPPPVSARNNDAADDSFDSSADELDNEDEEISTDEEINRAKDEDHSKSKKGQKRKRLTTAETFGSTLTSLLSEPAKKPKKTTAATTKVETEEPKPSVVAPANTILSLSHTKLPPSRSAENIERKAKRQIKALKEEKEDKARVRDVIEGWRAADGTGGMEFEKGLRKVAQRGVIKLFNAILVASKNAEATKTTLSAKAGVKEERGRKKEKDNVLGRGGKETALTQESFLDLVRKG